MVAFLFATIDLQSIIELPVRALRRVGAETFTSSNSELYLAVLLPQLAVLALYTLYRRRGSDRAPDPLFGRQVLRQRSSVIDVLLMTMNIALVDLLARLALTSFAVSSADRLLPSAQVLSGLSDQHRALAVTLMAVVGFVAVDVAMFVVHIGFHRIGVLWPFHSIHHEAPTLTPLTAFRVHPVERGLSVVGESLITGVIIGTWLNLGVRELATPLLLGTAAVGLVFRAAFASARHSSVPISFGPLDRIFVSPAMHQLHHSLAPEHFERNYGAMLSVWDRLLRCRVIPAPASAFRFGVAQRSGSSITESLFRPFADSAKVIATGARRIIRPTSRLQSAKATQPALIKAESRVPNNTLRSFDGDS